MSDAETKQGEEITTLDNHAPTPPADDTIVTLDNHAPTPPALGLDGK
ncbi:hypothetical protein [Streptomyces sp. NPDC020571]